MKNVDNPDDSNPKKQATKNAAGWRPVFIAFWLVLMGAVMALPRLYDGEQLLLVQGGLMVAAVLANWLWQGLRKRGDKLNNEE